MSREILSALLWPDLPKADARNNLRVVWSYLSELLSQADEGNPPLLSTRLDLQLNPHGDIWVDVAEFEQQLQACETHASQHEKRSTCPDCHKRLLRAVELYRGEFLSGLTLDHCEAFEEWQFVQRERLHLQCMDALNDIADFYEHEGQHALAERFARRQLELDPLREQTHRQVMRMLAYQGQRPAALAQFDTCKRLLSEVLGLEPDHETAALYQRIKANEISASVLASASASASAAAAKASSPPPAAKLHLPQSTTPFIGRDHELESIGARLQASDYRLFSIVGAGGIGKTRLAVQLARNVAAGFADGICFVPLTALQQADEIPAALWNALNAMTGNGNAPETTRTEGNGELSLWERTLATLSSQNMLLVFDNFEHLLHAPNQGHSHDAVDYLLALLQHAPNVRLIVTSREQLNIQAEDIFVLTGLPVPEIDTAESRDLAVAGQSTAVRLFCERAYRVNKQFHLAIENVAAVVRICRHVYGNPLGIELAATWLNSMSCDELAEALAHNLDLLETTMRDMPPQHRSMRAVINQSWQLLSPAEGTLLSRLSICRDGFTLEAATAIADATPITLTRLRRSNLLHMDGAGRYDMHELLRQFALDQLRQPQQSEGAWGEQALRQRHSLFYMQLVAAYEAELKGQQPRAAQHRIQVELENAREAWRWASEHQHIAEVAQAIAGCVGALRRFYGLSGLHAEAEQAFSAAIKHISATEEGLPLQIQLSLALAGALLRQGQLSAAMQHVQVGLELARQLGDVHSEAQGQMLMGWAMMEKGQLQESREHLEHARRLAQQLRNLALESEILRYLGSVLHQCGMHAEGERVLQQAHRIEQAMGNAAQEQTVLLYLGVNQLGIGDLAQARAYLEEALRLVPRTGALTTEAKVENAMGFLEARLGRFEIALKHHERSRQIAHDIGEPVQESHALHNLCTVNRKLGRLAEARRCGQEALRIAVECASSDAESMAWLHLGYVWLAQRELTPAQQAFTHTRELSTQVQRKAYFAEASAGLADVAFERSHFDEALMYIHTTMAYTAQHGFGDLDEPQEVRRIIERISSAAQIEVLEQSPT